MDLLSLPEEMLVSVYKYCCDPTLIKSRKVNTKINQVAVRNKLNKVCLREFKFTLTDDKIEVLLKDFQGNEKKQNADFTEEIRDTTIVSFVENLFTKVRFSNEFNIQGERGKRADVPNKLFHMMLENSKGMRIYMLRCDYLILEWDASLMRKLLTTFKFGCFDLLGCETPELGPHTSFFNGLAFDDLMIGYEIPLSLNDLKTICLIKVPQNLLTACTDVTLRDVLKIVKDAIGRMKKGDDLIYKLRNINCERMTDKEIRSLLQPLEDVTKTDIEDTNIRIYDNDGVDIKLYTI